MDTKYLLSVDEVIEGLGLGRTSVYALFKSGDLKMLKIGKRSFVRPEDLTAFIDAASQRNAA